MCILEQEMYKNWKIFFIRTYHEFHKQPNLKLNKPIRTVRSEKYVII
jgi:hypothetical protein